MANGDKIRFRQGERRNIASTDKVAGQLLFAKYDDPITALVKDPNTGALSIQSKTLSQGDIYFDLSGSQNGVRINIANDVDKARTLYSGRTRSDDPPGQWHVDDMEGVTELYDGLTITLRLSSESNFQYNTLNINGISDELVWYKVDHPLLGQLPIFSEIVLTYRTSGCGQFTTPPAATNEGVLPPQTTYTRGWVMQTQSSRETGVYYVVGPNTDTTAGTWTGTIPEINSLYDGLTIVYVPHVAGASTTTLNINGLGAKTCYYTNTSKLTTHFAVGTPILLTYINNTWKRADYDANSAINVYRQTSGYNGDYPLLVSRTALSSITNTNGSATNVYAMVYGSKVPTLNPSTGVMKVDTIVAKLDLDNGGSIEGIVPISSGGTGASLPSEALKNLIGLSAIGSSKKPMYWTGTAFSALTDTVGSTKKPVYLNGGEITALSDTVGSSKKPIYSNAGELTAFSSTIGGNKQFIYLNSGEITASTASEGDASAPIYLENGVFKEVNLIGVGNGGTGAGSFTQGALLQGNGSGAIGPSGAKGSASLPIYIDSSGKPQTISSYQGASRYLNSPDTRNDAINPSDLNAATGVRFDFKARTTVGLPTGANYAGVMSYRPYASGNDWTGGPAHQIAYNGDGKIYHRISADSSTWGGWEQILTSNSSIPVNNLSDVVPVSQGGTGNDIFTQYRLVWAETGSKLASTPYAHINYSAGTTSAQGYEELVLGNSTKAGTALNAFGRLAIYSSGKTGGYITAAPLDSGWPNHVLPTTAGWLVTAGNGSSTGAGNSNKPVYVSTSGVATAVSDNSVIVNLESTTAVSTYAASPKIGVEGILPITSGGTNSAKPITNGRMVYSHTDETTNEVALTTSDIAITGTGKAISVTGASAQEGEYIAQRGTRKMFMGFGSGNENHGIYSYVKNDWIVYANASGAVTLNGNAATATKLATKRSITVDFEGSHTPYPGFDGSANVYIGFEGVLGIGDGGTGAGSAADALKNLIGTTAIGSNKKPIYWSGTAFGTMTGVGSSTEPVYFSSSGEITKGSKYAGGTAITLNNSSKAGSTASFYAPTSGAAAGQVLIAAGTGANAPTWTSNLTISSTAVTAAKPFAVDDNNDSTNSLSTTASIVTAGGVSVAKNLSAKTIRIDNNQSTKGVSLQYNETSETLNFVFA